MGYNIKTGDIKTLGKAKVKVLSAPIMSRYWEEKGETFGWVKCKVIEDPTGKYKVGDVKEFNGDFLI